MSIGIPRIWESLVSGTATQGQDSLPLTTGKSREGPSKASLASIRAESVPSSAHQSHRSSSGEKISFLLIYKYIIWLQHTGSSLHYAGSFWIWHTDSSCGLQAQ